MKLVTVLVVGERELRTKEENMRAKEWKETTGASPGIAEQSQLEPNAPGKYREPATPKRHAAHVAWL